METKHIRCFRLGLGIIASGLIIFLRCLYVYGIQGRTPADDLTGGYFGIFVLILFSCVAYFVYFGPSTATVETDADRSVRDSGESSQASTDATGSGGADADGGGDGGD